MYLLTSPTDRYADLPPHVLTTSGGCRNCTALDVDGFADYDAYVAHFYDVEWEGEPGHRPMPRDEWEYLEASCLGDDDGRYAVPATERDGIATGIRTRLPRRVTTLDIGHGVHQMWRAAWFRDTTAERGGWYGWLPSGTIHPMVNR